MSSASATRVCVERDCDKPAGGQWSPYWCPKHDAERVERISRSLDAMTVQMGIEAQHDPE